MCSIRPHASGFTRSVVRYFCIYFPIYIDYTQGADSLLNLGRRILRSTVVSLHLNQQSQRQEQFFIGSARLEVSRNPRIVHHEEQKTRRNLSKAITVSLSTLSRLGEQFRSPTIARSAFSPHPPQTPGLDELLHTIRLPDFES